MSRRAGRIGRAVSAVAVVGLLGGVTAGASPLPEPADVAAPGPAVAVPAGTTTLVCPGPLSQPDDSAAGDAAFDPTPVDTRTSQRVASTTAPGARTAAPLVLTPLTGDDPLLELDGEGATRAGGIEAVGGPTLVHAGPVDGSTATVAAATASVTPLGDLRGLAAASCRPPAASTWLVGGSTELGSSALLVVTNPGRTPAEVTVDLWGPTGRLDAAGASTLLVAPGAERALLLEGVAAEQRRIAVHVSAAGGLVAAHLQDSRLDGFTPAGTDLVTAGAAPATRQVVGGLVVPASGTGEEGTAQLRLLAPGDARAVVAVTLLGPQGPVTLPGLETVDLGPGEVTDLSLAGLPAGAYTAVLDADTPVVAGAMLTRAGPPVELDDVPTVERAWSPSRGGSAEGSGSGGSGSGGSGSGAAGSGAAGAAGPADASGAGASTAGGPAGLVALPDGVGPTVVVGAVPPGEISTAPAGPPVTGTLRLLGEDGGVLAEQALSVPAGTTARVDVGGLAGGAEVAAVQVVPDDERPTAATLAWWVLATVGGGADELLSVLAPVPAPQPQPTVRVRPDPRPGLP